METDSASKVPLTLEGDYVSVSLTQKGDHVYYRRHKKHPANPVFRCRLDHDITQKLITDPGSIMLRKPKRTIFFWPKALMHGICTDGQFVFETFSPQDTDNPQIKLAARTLFQLDGDMLVKIDKTILARTDGIEIIEAHFGWTNWCFEQLKIPHFLTVVLRCAPKLSLIRIALSVIKKIISKVFAWWLKRKIKQFL